MSRYYTGPISDHFDGERFFDPHGSKPRSRRELLRWRFGRDSRSQRVKWPGWAPSPYADRPPQRVEGTAWRVAYVGHASFLIQTAGLNILFDPVWSKRASPFRFAGPKRVNDPGIAFDDLPPIDVVLVSHGHYDHLDIATLSRLAATHHPRVITPLGNDTIMRNHDSGIAARGYDWHDRAVLSPDVSVTLVPTRHWSARTLSDRNMSLWASFVIEAPGGRAYLVGDSAYGDGGHFHRVRERYGSFKLALLPIGAYEPRWFMRDQHMNPEEAVQAFIDCGAERALGHHYGTFQLTDEAIDAPVIGLGEALQAKGIAGEKFRAPKPGQTIEF
ncbi:MAG TPA: MBL fold metallo-hydrolase [Xanthobacteraceae bacterium]|jgi:L-ascorbate metabolism protein UlaG (beta-lactamase superfamily)|nr:MBL fold metallo-hydrolase [Xanthobacteraceae bacterium]